MSETKHTPGPWKIRIPEKGQDGFPNNWAIDYESTIRACYLASIPGAAHKKEWQANARLIASAPELLEALVNINRMVGLALYGDRDIEYMLSRIMDKAQQAINKTKGE